MNASAKGLRNEKKCADHLEKAGYSVAKVIRVKDQPRDFFGLFDVIAINSQRVRLIQVKSNRLPSPKERERIFGFSCPVYCTKEIWINYDYKGWRVIVNGKEVVRPRTKKKRKMG